MTTSEANPAGPKARDLLYEAAQLYERFAPGHSFERDLLLHLRFGLVYCDDHVLLLARQVSRTASIELIEDPSYIFEKPDAWWIHLCVGDMRTLLRLHEHGPLDFHYWIGWRRRNGSGHFYPYYTLCHRVLNAVPPRFLPPGATSPVEAAINPSLPNP